MRVNIVLHEIIAVGLICVMIMGYVFSKRRDFVREMEEEMFRDIGSKMMIFQNKRVWERWVVVVCNRCYLREMQEHGNG